VQDRHRQRAEQPGGDPGPADEQPDDTGERGVAVPRRVVLLGRAASRREPVTDQRAWGAPSIER
jgi:hypothetical protein